MGKYFPYIVGVLLVAAVVILFITGSNNRKHKFDDRLTLRRQDKIPYGTYAAFKNLKYLFPNADIYTSKQEPGYWDSLSVYESKQAYISICYNFNPEESEMKRLLRFVENGNDVFISARQLSYAATKVITQADNEDDLRQYFSTARQHNSADTLTISLLDPPYTGGYSEYRYPGKRLIGFFEKINTATTDIFGNDEEGAPYFIHLRAGKGNFFIHLAPLAFSNYFILHKNNIEYYEKALSVISPDVTKIVWDEYFLLRKDVNQRSEKKSWLKVLFRYPALRAALLTALFALLVYMLMESRRKQRYIPVVTTPKNDSLDFVKTIGRLYFDKGDHKNLCRKMAAYFLEHVRNRYKLPTVTLDENFISQLHFKSGIDESEIRGIVSFIKYLDDVPAIKSEALADFHKQLELFYKKA
ncbi:MAG TPA: DUF4350 domain-containing protein [Chitinophagaceae bacterium]|nr:DUF4350 domain-containing protein [Chitinophagaceae bacterium]